MRPLTLYLVFVSLNTAAMTVTAATYGPYLYGRGFSVKDVALANISFWLVLALAEVPTGLFADRFGRRTALALAMGCGMLGKLVYARIQTFGDVLCAEVLLALGFSFASGAQQAWLATALGSTRSDATLSRAFSLSSMCSAATGLLAGVGGVMLTRFGAPTSFYAGAAMYGVAVIFVLTTMHDVASRSGPRDDSGSSAVPQACVLSRSVAIIRKMPVLGWLAGVQVVYALIVPYNHVWAQLTTLRLGEQSLAWGWVAIEVGLTMGGLLALRVDWARSLEMRLLCMVTCMALGMLALAVPSTSGLAVFGAIILHQTPRGAIEPTFNVARERLVKDDDIRATVASLLAVAGRVGALTALCVTALVAPKGASAADMEKVLVYASVLMLAATCVLGVVYLRMKKTQAVAVLRMTILRGRLFLCGFSTSCLSLQTALS